MATRAAWGLAALQGPAAAASAGDWQLARALALYASSRVDAAEDQLQRQGVAQALSAPEAAAAFT